ncbi:MAG: hypothetical protein WC215_03645 [Bacilli bacterium]
MSGNNQYNQEGDSSFSKNVNEFGFKKKRRFISYLPALFITIITITLLLIIIIGTICCLDNNQEAQVRVLHGINFTDETATFDENYVFEPIGSEEPVFIVEQGFRFDTLDSKIEVLVPNYEETLSIDINFGAFNHKTYSVGEFTNDNYLIQAHDSSNALLNSKIISSPQNDSEYKIDFELENIDYLLLIFNQPITSIGEETTRGYLYLKSLALNEITNYS